MCVCERWLFTKETNYNKKIVCVAEGEQIKVCVCSWESVRFHAGIDKTPDTW